MRDILPSSHPLTMRNIILGADLSSVPVSSLKKVLCPLLVFQCDLNPFPWKLFCLPTFSHLLLSLLITQALLIPPAGSHSYSGRQNPLVELY